MGKHAGPDTSPMTIIPKPPGVDVKQPSAEPEEQPNVVRKYAKGIVAILGAVAVALTPLGVGDGTIDLPEAIQAGVALLTALGVIGVRNGKKK